MISVEIRAFLKGLPKGAIIKPLHGSGGKNVFHIAKPNDFNLSQIVEATSAEGYLITQAYMEEAKSGDVRLFLMNGKPLERDGKYAALNVCPPREIFAPTSMPQVRRGKLGSRNRCYRSQRPSGPGFSRQECSWLAWISSATGRRR